MWARERCRISPPRFLAECCKKQLNQGSFVLLYFRLFTFSDLYWVCLYFPVLFCLSVSVKWLAVKTASEMTSIVSGGALNSTQTKGRQNANLDANTSCQGNVWARHALFVDENALYWYVSMSHRRAYLVAVQVGCNTCASFHQTVILDSGCVTVYTAQDHISVQTGIHVIPLYSCSPSICCQSVCPHDGSVIKWLYIWNQTHVGSWWF